ncbi:MAG: hypothetical protein KGM49_14200 [Sphingomonadales bacterium]|nr:hypothetical protein [Sphingomonadales bacterium]
MTHSTGPMLGFGLIGLCAGLFIVTRRGGSEQAVYARRIVGMMLTGGGLALTLFSLSLMHGVG